MDAQPAEPPAVEQVGSGSFPVEPARDGLAQAGLTQGGLARADLVAAERLLEASGQAGWAEVQDDPAAPAPVVQDDLVAAAVPDDYSADSLGDDCLALPARVAVSAWAVDSAASEPQQAAHLQRQGWQGDSSAGWPVDSPAAVPDAPPFPVGCPVSLQSASLVCPVALPSPSAAPQANWPDAASALRSSPTAVRDVRPAPEIGRAHV